MRRSKRSSCSSMSVKPFAKLIFADCHRQRLTCVKGDDERFDFTELTRRIGCGSGVGKGPWSYTRLGFCAYLSDTRSER
jgi:hypothetical protein